MCTVQCAHSGADGKSKECKEHSHYIESHLLQIIVFDTGRKRKRQREKTSKNQQHTIIIMKTLWQRGTTSTHSKRDNACIYVFRVRLFAISVSKAIKKQQQQTIYGQKVMYRRQFVSFDLFQTDMQ